MAVINNFSQILFESPVDKIIRQIRDLISSGQLNSGDRLPSERQLSEKLGVGRTHLRDAIRKLEFYGILNTRPQSGTFVAGLGLPALQGLLTDMINLQPNDFKSLVYTRVVLETSLARLAAEHRTDKDLFEIEKAFKAHKSKIKLNVDAVEEDFMFHLRIADASKNSVMKSLMMIITPDILHYFKKHDACGNGKAVLAIQQHEILMQHIVDKSGDAAAESLRSHLESISEFSKNIKEEVKLNWNNSN